MKLDYQRGADPARLPGQEETVLESEAGSQQPVSCSHVSKRWSVSNRLVVKVSSARHTLCVWEKHAELGLCFQWHRLTLPCAFLPVFHSQFVSF